MAVDDAHVFPGILTPVLTQLFFPKPMTTFPTCFSRGDRQKKCAGKKVRLNRVSTSQSAGHESDMLTSEPPGRGSIPLKKKKKKTLRENEKLIVTSNFSFSRNVFINFYG